MKGYVTEDDIIHRLQIIRDLVRNDRKFDADVNLDSLQRIFAEEKLKSDNSDNSDNNDNNDNNDNSDYAKCNHDFEPRKTWVHTCKKCGTMYIEKGHFA